VLIPAKTSAEALAYLSFVPQNTYVPPEYFAAVFKSWSVRYGAELIALGGHQTMDIRVTRRPQTRQEALELAHQHHDYCVDAIDQGLGTLERHASLLMASDGWSFWWD
jgi:hypothetical protein